MAKERQKWTPEEEEALFAGVEKHGQGKWKVILTDPQFASTLANRSNIDLKDKWRNVSVNRDKVRTPMLEGVTTSTKSPSNSPKPLSAVPLIEYGGMSVPSSTVDRRTAPDYKVMILEALSSSEDPNGPDTNAILSFIEHQNFEVPENFKRSVISKLRRLVLTGELEKVDNHFKVKGAFSGAERFQREDAAGPSNNDNRDKEQKASDTPDSPVATETLEDAALYAALAVARAENTEQKAIEACEEADRIAKMVEESMAMLKLAEELHEMCLRDGIVLLAP